MLTLPIVGEPGLRLQPRALEAATLRSRGCNLRLGTAPVLATATLAKPILATPTLATPELSRLSTARLIACSASSDNSIILTMSNGSSVQFNGFWERDSCVELLRACARFLSHDVEVVLAGSHTEAAAVASLAVPAPASAGVGALATPATVEPAPAQPALEVAAAAAPGS